ncbi:MAG TPA: TonB-dependent receptor [Dissulfurispiraceae bacterium]
MARVFFLFFFLAAALFAPVSGYPSETRAAASGHSKEVIEDMLMFWEEKDLYVQSPTRHEKPISQVAENMTVVTAKEIEDMNAHSLSEVLSRVTGVFVDFTTADFDGSALLHIQGSAPRQVLVLLDGVVWNTLTDGTVAANDIPVRTIERIEVIKGPASSAWGSSLGGVVNIITKGTGDSRRPSGRVIASYGERTTQDDSAELAGKAGPVGYYLFAGKQESNGLRNDRAFDNYSLYAKLDLPVSKDVRIGFTGGYSEPRMDSGIAAFDLITRSAYRTLFGTVSLDASLSPELALKASLFSFKRKFVQSNTVLGTGMLGPAGDLFKGFIDDEKTEGGSAKLIWTRGRHTAVLGTDISSGKMDMTTDVGPLYQRRGVPATTVIQPEIDKWAVFANDTITLGKFSITPGLRHDYNSVGGSFTSPSLGATYKFGEHTIGRFSVARGFSTPSLGSVFGGGLFLNPNPALNPEKVWSYQAGLESGITDYLWAKITLFRHDVKDSLVKERVTPTSRYSIYVNDGGVRRQGVELEAETVPFHNISLKGGFAYVDIRSDDPTAPSVNYMYTTGIKYNDKKSFMAQLLGNYTWWNLTADYGAKYDAFIWDANLVKKVFSTEKTSAEIFLTAHNLFNGSYYTLNIYPDPHRWIEAGIKYRF